MFQTDYQLEMLNMSFLMAVSTACFVNKNVDFNIWFSWYDFFIIIIIIISEEKEKMKERHVFKTHTEIEQFTCYFSCFL